MIFPDSQQDKKNTKFDITNRNNILKDANIN